MGGEIGVDSDSGKGSKFWLSLPFSTYDNVCVEAYSIGHVVLYQPRVEIREIMRCQLEALGNHVNVVNTLSELLQSDNQSKGKPAFYCIIDIEYIKESEREALLQHLHEHPDYIKQWVFIIGINEKNTEISNRLDQEKAIILIKPISQIKLQRLLNEPEEDIKPAPDLSDMPQKSRGKILLVEDNRVNQAVGKGLLKRVKFDVVIANDGIEAIEIFQQENFDLIFMDVNMPQMGGIESCQKIKQLMQQDKYPSIPIIALTANAMQGATEMYIEKGMDDYLAKPIDIEKLKEMLNRWIKPN